MRFWLCFILGFAAFAAVALAQDVLAPKVKSLPGIEVPAGVETPESGLVRVMVRIDPDGKGVVEKCDAGRALCDLAIEAIRQAEFEPATRDETPVPSEISVELRVRKPVAEEAPGRGFCRNFARTREDRSRKGAGLLRNRRGGRACAGADQAGARWSPKYPRDLWRAVSNSRDDAGHRAGRQRPTLRLRSWRPAVGDGLSLRRHSGSFAVSLRPWPRDAALGSHRRDRALLRRGTRSLRAKYRWCRGWDGSRNSKR